MIKTTILPQSDSYNLPIPKKYIGKKLEVLFYATDELMDEHPVLNKKPSDFFGTLSIEEGKNFHDYINKAREEWNRNI
jgi:hypothetical protein